MDGEQEMSFPLSPESVSTVHEPVKEVVKKSRRKLLFFDRAKILVILGTFLGFSTALEHSDIPIITWADAFRNQLEKKSWILVVGGIELVRQAHLFLSERNANYHHFWTQNVWGAWDRFWSKRNPWLRYRLNRIAKVAFWVTIIVGFFSALWGVSFIDGLAMAPKRFFYNPFGTGQQPWWFNIIFYMGMAIMQFVAIFWFMSRGGVETYMPEDIKTRFTDVWGQDAVLDKVKENIVFLNEPTAIEARGGSVPGGILLWGPPGTGKTLMAEAVAGETSRPFVFVDPGSFRAMFVGVGVMKVRSLYKKLRKLSLRYGGVIVFFDEADTLGNRGGQASGGFNQSPSPTFGCNAHHYVSQSSQRVLADTWDAHAAARSAPEPKPAVGGIRGVIAGMGGMGAMDGSLQAILAEMSGLRKPKGGFWRWMRSFLLMAPKTPPKYRILTIMATNMPDSLDPALLRPGRIDRIYYVGFPKLDGRIKTFEGYLDKVRHDLSPAQVRRLAVISPRVSGAQVKDIVNEALIMAMRRGRATVTWQDVLDARVFKVHGVPDGVAATKLEQWEVAIHEASHAVAMYRLIKREVIDIATIEQRRNIGGFVAPVPVEERDANWRFEMEDDVMTFLASRAGERMFFGENSGGVYGDLSSSTRIVIHMLTMVGMGDTIAAMDGKGDHRRSAVDDAVEAKLQELFAKVSQLLESERWFVLAIAHALISRSTITGEDITAIDEGTVGVVLDGAWYHDQANRLRLEEFHARARAHHEDKAPYFRHEVPNLPSMGLPPPPPAPAPDSAWAPA